MSAWRRRRHGVDGGPYPPYIRTRSERRRWDRAERRARELFGDVDEANVWMATRAIFRRVR